MTGNPWWGKQAELLNYAQRPAGVSHSSTAELISLAHLATEWRLKWATLLSPFSCSESKQNPLSAEEAALCHWSHQTENTFFLSKSTRLRKIEPCQSLPREVSAALPGSPYFIVLILSVVFIPLPLSCLFSSSSEWIYSTALLSSSLNPHLLQIPAAYVFSFFFLFLLFYIWIHRNVASSLWQKPAGMM